MNLETIKQAIHILHKKGEISQELLYHPEDVVKIIHLINNEKPKD